MQACNLTRLLLKMAVTMADRYESALKTLENIAEAGGYMKMVVREDMQKAVSIIRNCFKELTSTGDDKIRKGDQIEVKEGESEHHFEEGDSHRMGQVAPSIEKTPKIKNNNINSGRNSPLRARV